MPSTQLPNLGLFKGWSTGDKGWGEEVNQNFCKLDAIAGGVCVTGQILTADLPAAANQGEQFFLTDTNEIATFQGGTFLKCPAPKGLVFVDAASGLLFNFNGGSVQPSQTQIPTGMTSDILNEVPGLYVTADVVCDAIRQIFGAGALTGTGAPTVPPADHELPLYCDVATNEIYIWDGAAWVIKTSPEPEYINTYDQAGAGSASSDLFVKTRADGCIDEFLVKRYPTYPTTADYENSIGGAANLIGGERMYDPVSGTPFYYNAVLGQWLPEAQEPCMLFEAELTSSQIIPNNSTTIVGFDNIITDDFGGGITNGIWTVQAGQEGCYLINSSVGFNLTTSNDHDAAQNADIFHNGVRISQDITFWENRNGFGLIQHVYTHEPNEIIDLAAGDTIDIRVQSFVSPVNIYAIQANSFRTFLQITKLGRR